MQKLYKVILIITVFIASAGLSVFAATWNTSWISDGEVISAEKIKSHLDYLYENKVHTPTTCTGENKVLQWKDGDWECYEE